MPPPPFSTHSSRENRCIPYLRHLQTPGVKPSYDSNMDVIQETPVIATSKPAVGFVVLKRTIVAIN
ncbi:hypothetical protein AA0119_g10079 [Alternaria tenuissima]|uniref:Uncharacterized protein n=2 Tax=Alternaria alternata complex TaxID=187734 RepID=A0A4Q4N4A6_ALTAL|nr:hypothetical protein AA0115_g11516 [Alternaria tenuissima]RYN68105.1 hypothetical protein AA0117_g11383 [Alternaria alternata]RYN92339.1 hypothetical protein AA0119_g10079 [Alternaria tenuissima]RYO09017.1 hypothetical protein AA0121_g11223 [Alternaria tenuissima]